MSKPVDDSSAVATEEFDLIEAFLDGDLADDLDSAARQQFEARLATSATLRDELHLAERIRGGLQALPALECPPQVTRTVLAHAAANRSAQASQSHSSFWSQLAALLAGSGAKWLRPALAGAALLAVLAILLPWMPSAEQPAGIADAEVARAEQEVKLALAYLGQIGQRATHQVSEEVLGHRLVAPIARTVSTLGGRSSRAGETNHAL